MTGTGSGVGKTVTAAALAACAVGTVAVVKLVQTGCAPAAAVDAAEITRLAKPALAQEFARHPDAVAPRHAAMLAGTPALVLADAVRRVIDLDALHDLVLVEGTGGLLTEFDSADRWTLIDLAYAVDAGFVVVTAVGADMVSDAALVVTTLRDHQSLDVAGIVVGSWPADADLPARYGLFDLQTMAPRSELAGVLPAGLASGPNFRRRARASLAPGWGGTLADRAFVTRQRP